jgi:hypothetical protein
LSSRCFPRPLLLAIVPLVIAPAAGLAWTAPGVLNTSATADIRFDSSLCMATNGAGTWLSAWCSNTTVGADLDVRWSRSTNGGASWSAPAVLNTKTPGIKAPEDGAVVAAGAAGIWMAAWSSEDKMAGTISDDKDILFARSTDDGVSWGGTAAIAPAAATDNTHDYAPALSSDGNATWVAAWEACEFRPPSVLGRDGDLLFTRSTDNGLAWAAPQALNTNATADARLDRCAQLATDRAGHWVAVWQSVAKSADALGADWDIFVVRSADNGANWTAPAALNSNAAVDSGADTGPSIATDGIGNWVTAWSSSDTLGGSIGADDDIVFARSTNDGATWSACAALNTNAATDTGTDSAPCIAFAGGKFVAVWQSTDLLGGAHPVDSDIMFATSADGGATWSPPALLNSNALVDSVHDTAPCIAGDASGLAVTAWRTLIADRADGDMLYARGGTSASAEDWSLHE